MRSSQAEDILRLNQNMAKNALSGCSLPGNPPTWFVLVKGRRLIFLLRWLTFLPPQSPEAASIYTYGGGTLCSPLRTLPRPRLYFFVRNSLIEVFVISNTKSTLTNNNILTIHPPQSSEVDNMCTYRWETLHSHGRLYQDQGFIFGFAYFFGECRMRSWLEWRWIPEQVISWHTNMRK